MRADYKECPECGLEFHIRFFRKTSIKRDSGFVYETTQRRCKACCQTKSDQTNQENRWKRKAYHCVASHYGKYKKIGYAGSLREWMQEYGWSIDHLAHDFEHAWKNGCPRCRTPFQSMGHGLSDITLDIYDRSKLPTYGNTRIICMSCNRSKGSRDPIDWDLDQIDYQRWQIHQDELKKDPFLRWPLFRLASNQKK